jgi:hypothetical protein
MILYDEYVAGKVTDGYNKFADSTAGIVARASTHNPSEHVQMIGWFNLFKAGVAYALESLDSEREFYDRQDREAAEYRQQEIEKILGAGI